MRRFLLTLAVLAIAATSFAQQQTYHPVPFPSGRTFWCEQYDSIGVRNGMLDYFHVRNTFFLNGEDTIISGIRLKKLFFSYNGDTTNACYYGGIYEDSLRRVWYNGKNHHILKIFSKLQTNILVCYLIFRLMLETLLII